MLKEGEKVPYAHNVTFPQKQLMLQKYYVIITIDNKASIKVYFDNILAVWKYWNIMSDYWNAGSDFVHMSAFLGCWFYTVWNSYATMIWFFLPDRGIQENLFKWCI